MLAAIAFLALAVSLVFGAQSQPAKTVLDGVYTETQAARGENAYAQNCARCHGETLGGGGAAPMLYTLEFLDRWREDVLSSLFQFIQTSMPLAPGPGPGGLKQSQYLDIAAFILSRNDFPAGSSELTAADLETTLLVGLNGPKPLPPSATVRVVGCLAHPSGAWALTRSTSPSRVRKGDETDAAELERSSRAALGSQEFRLPNIDDDYKESDLLAQVGKKVQVKGVLNGQGATARISVLLFKALGQDCN